MDNTALADLKQFIAATVSQAVADIIARQDSTEAKLQQAIQKIEDLDAKVDTIADALSEDLQDHEQRITKLETQAA